MRRPDFLSLLCIAALLLGCLFPLTANADEGISLQQARQLAKQMLPDVEFPEQFVAGYSEWRGRPTWELRWQSPDWTKGSLFVSIDAETGEMVEFYSYKDYPSGQRLAAVPRLSQTDTLKLAQQFLQRVAPEKLALCRYEPTDEPAPVLSLRRWPVQHYFRFTRYENDIPFPANGIGVGVNSDTGEIMSYHLNWNDVEFTSAEDLKSAEEALETIRDSKRFELQYVWPSTPYAERPFVAYVMQDADSLGIDAETGEFVQEWFYPDTYQPPSGWVSPMPNPIVPRVTPKELSGLLTKQQAELRAREVYSIPAHLFLERAELSADWQMPNQSLWYLSFAPKAGSTQTYEYISLTLNAKTGELWGYNHNKDYYSPGAELSREQALDVAKAYLAKEHPSKEADLELVIPSQSYPDPYFHQFTFRRIVNGIPFPANYINLTVVASSTPFIAEFQVRWTDCQFDQVEALDYEEAFERLAQQHPLRLEYRLSQGNVPWAYEKGTAVKGDTMRLVYRFAPPMFQLFSPTELIPLAHDGRLLQRKRTELPIDVVGHWAASDINRLLSAGLIEVPNGVFEPNAPISLGEWLQMLGRAAGWSNEFSSLPEWAKEQAASPYAGWLSSALRMRIVQSDEEIDLDASITRETMFVQSMRILGLDQASDAAIYNLEGKDADLISPAYRGYLALANHFKLLTSSKGYYRPQDATTKAEAAVVLMRLLRFER